METRQLGPVIGATLIHTDLNYVVNSYQRNLGFSLVSRGKLSAQIAKMWQAPKLIDTNVAIMASANNDSWLRIVEDKSAKPATPLKSYGWMALETNVKDVDAIRAKLKDDSFEVIGEPAYLQVSDAIKVMQVIGPAGEVSYLTQVERDVPPFELPMTNSETGSLFIPVLCTPNLAQSLAFYQSINNADKGLQFDTKITVLNNAWGHHIDHQYPVATLQLDGKCLFEIDELADTAPVNNNQGALPSGIAMISCRVKNIEQVAQQFQLTTTEVDNEYYPANKVLLLKGPAGELIELVG